jgi:hypothetical protein
VTVVKVFSATKFADRDMLGDRVSEWINSKQKLKVSEIRTLLSSDEQFHCLVIVVIGSE